MMAMGMVLLYLRAGHRKSMEKFHIACRCAGLACLALSASGWIDSLFPDQAVKVDRLMWLLITSIQSLLFTATCIILTDIDRKIGRSVCRDLLLMGATFGTCYTLKHLWPGMGTYIELLALAMIIGQFGFYVTRFRIAHKEALTRLEAAYDDDVEDRTRWVRRLFYSALVVGVASLVLTTIDTPVAYNVFLVLAVCYYIRVTIAMVNYVDRSRFFEKVTYNPAAEQEQVAEEEVAPEPVINIEEIQAAVDQWVAQKRFTDADVTVAEIAKELGVSRVDLSHYFSDVICQQFRTWRMKLRIEEAERILHEHPEIGTSELCVMAGYNDRSNFHKHFTKITGKSLAQYRATLFHEEE